MAGRPRTHARGADGGRRHSAAPQRPADRRPGRQRPRDVVVDSRGGTSRRRAVPGAARAGAAMTPTARVLQSASRWLQRRAKKRTGPETTAAYREAIALLNRLVKQRKEGK